MTKLKYIVLGAIYYVSPIKFKHIVEFNLIVLENDNTNCTLLVNATGV